MQDVDTLDDGGLKRGLKNRHVQLIALGGIIGSAFFLGTGAVVGEVGPAAFIAYMLGGLVVYLVMICMGELSVAMPVSGSFVTYASEFISRPWAAGVGWTYWINWVAYIPAECIAGGIIMHAFVPSISEWAWAILFGIVITAINLVNVKAFGEAEFWLAITKILGLVFFSVMAVLILFGVIGGDAGSGIGFIGFDNLFADGKGLFPLGFLVVLNTMILLLVNYQGSEIIGLAAGEAKDPSKTIPIAVRNVVLRILLLYLVPVFLLVMILPWQEAGVSESVFATALSRYGLNWAGALFSFVALTAAISCANSGMYGTVRSLWSLSREGMAPRFLTRLNKNAVPNWATLATMVGIWLFLAASYFFSASAVFVALISISGFTGTMCWISLCWSQFNFRRRLYAAGYTSADLKYRTPGYPYTALAGVFIQVAVLVFVAMSPDLRVAFYFGVPCLVIPMVAYWWMARRGRVRPPSADRITFDDLFPARGAAAAGAGPHVAAPAHPDVIVRPEPIPEPD
jgi:AAT family amino acid transporter